MKSNNPSERKEEFDDLPIGSVIARFLTLLEFRRCSFKDVLFPGGKFHCFKGTPEKRKTAIHNINVEISAITKQETLKKKHHVKELQGLFSSKRHLVEMEKLSRKEKNCCVRLQNHTLKSIDNCITYNYYVAYNNSGLITNIMLRRTHNLVSTL